MPKRYSHNSLSFSTLFTAFFASCPKMFTSTASSTCLILPGKNFQSLLSRGYTIRTREARINALFLISGGNMIFDFLRADDRFFTLISGDWSSMIRESIPSSWGFNPLRGWVKMISLPTLAFSSSETVIPIS